MSEDYEDVAYVRVQRLRQRHPYAVHEYSITVLDAESSLASVVTTAGFSTVEAAMGKAADLVRACLRAREEGR